MAKNPTEPKRPRGRPSLTPEEARNLFRYDPNTGELFWMIARTSGIKPGDPAGYPNGAGYIVVGALGKKYTTHRLAWVITHGAWPSGQIDHINGCKTDNRLENLRDVSVSVNQQNRRRAEVTNQCGLLGVSRTPDGRKWRARICLDGVSRHIGRFDTAEAAHLAYIEKKRALHAGCCL